MTVPSPAAAPVGTGPAKLTILVIRHAQTDHNLHRVLQGHLDVPLNSTGHEQARRLGRYLKTHLRQQNMSVAAVWSSDLARCRQTVAGVLGELGLQARVVDEDAEQEENEWEDVEEEVEQGASRKVRVVYTKQLRERSMGELQGKKIADAKAMAERAGKTFLDYGEVS